MIKNTVTKKMKKNECKKSKRMNCENYRKRKKIKNRLNK